MSAVQPKDLPKLSVKGKGTSALHLQDGDTDLSYTSLEGVQRVVQAFAPANNVEDIRGIPQFPTVVDDFIPVPPKTGYRIKADLNLLNGFLFPAGNHIYFKGEYQNLNMFDLVGMTTEFMKTKLETETLTSFTDDGGNLELETSGLHNMLVDQFVNIQDTSESSYNQISVQILAVTDTTHFTVNIPFIGTSTGGFFSTGILTMELRDLNTMSATAFPSIMDIEFIQGPGFNTELFMENCQFDNFDNIFNFFGAQRVTINNVRMTSTKQEINVVNAKFVTIKNIVIESVSVSINDLLNIVATTGNEIEELVIEDCVITTSVASQAFLDIRPSSLSPTSKVSISRCKVLGPGNFFDSLSIQGDDPRINVKDCFPVPNSQSIIEMFRPDTLSAFSVTILASGWENAVEIDTTLSEIDGDLEDGWEHDASDATVTYNGINPRHVTSSYNATLDHTGSGTDTIGVTLYRIASPAGNPTGEISEAGRVSAFDVEQVTVSIGQFNVGLVSPGDKFQLFTANLTNGSDVLVDSFRLVMRGDK